MASQELQNLITMFKSRPVADPNATIQEMRAGFEAMAAMFGPLPADVTVTPVDAGGVKAEWVVAGNADPATVILYLHGGGYVIGSPASHRDLTQRLSRASGARVLSLDYRMGPEHPFPAAVEDAVAAYRWLLAQGVAPSRMVISGDSAGGGLTLATLVALRGQGVALPAAAAPISPWTDMEGIGESMTTKAAVDPMVQKAGLAGMAAMYLGGADPRNPLAAPLYADYRGLPPLLIQVGTSETLLDDSTRVAAKAKAAGVEVTLEPWEDMIHVWHLFAAMLPEGQQAIERIGQFVRQRTGLVAV
ncbi:MAG: alpha/beta hydrolase [Chloroflexi bacterium]|nr:alpha/beta hydrolase [Chloroflexota bacterium]